MYIGIDLGTSGVKSILMSKDGSILASKTVELSVARKHPLWSEQNPSDWWDATCASIHALSENVDLSNVEAVGLAGQMHGATLLGSEGEILRPAILWNDGRCFAECEELEAMVSNSREITGNIMMPGFTAPKLKWVEKNEPEIFKRVAKVLLPKDYLRFKMTGDYASDMSDSAGTCWLNVEKRDWDDSLLKATHLSRSQMPQLFEGTDITGYLTPEVAKSWGMSCIPVIAGGSDNAAGAIGVGIIKPGQAMLSLGTSGVYFSVSDGFVSNPNSALHSFCHALPERWHTMSVILSAASCLKWVCDLTGFDDISSMLSLVEQNDSESSSVIFLPYLSGERTPHNNPSAKGVFFGLTHSTTKVDLARAVLEGVGFAFADGLDALHETKNIPEEISLIGGGARSEFWRQMLADIVNMPLVYRKGGDIGPALGAARLALLATKEGINIDKACPVPSLVQRHEPNIEKQDYYQEKRRLFKSLYENIEILF